jgi:hypothetical protein
MLTKEVFRSTSARHPGAEFKTKVSNPSRKVRLNPDKANNLGSACKVGNSSELLHAKQPAWRVKSALFQARHPAMSRNSSASVKRWTNRHGVSRWNSFEERSPV